MNIKRLFVFFIAVLLVISLAACVRSKSTPEATQSPGEGGEPVQPVVTDMMGQLEIFATQTAMALGTQGIPQQPETEPTVQPPAGETAMPPQDIQPTPEPTATRVPMEIPTISVPGSYTLQKGEFPYCIARRFNVDPGELLRLNGLGGSSYFYAGMTLQIPQSGNPFPGNRTLRSHPTTYNAQPGDTIYSIACYFGDVSPEAIAAANGMTDPPFRVTAGQALNIP